MNIGKRLALERKLDRRLGAEAVEGLIDEERLGGMAGGEGVDLARRQRRAGGVVGVDHHGDVRRLGGALELAEIDPRRILVVERVVEGSVLAERRHRRGQRSASEHVSQQRERLRAPVQRLQPAWVAIQEPAELLIEHFLPRAVSLNQGRESVAHRSEHPLGGEVVVAHEREVEQFKAPLPAECAVEDLRTLLGLELEAGDRKVVGVIDLGPLLAVHDLGHDVLRGDVGEHAEHQLVV